MAEIEELQNFHEDPANELELDQNLKIKSNNREEIFELMATICKSLIKEQESLNS